MPVWRSITLHRLVRRHRPRFASYSEAMSEIPLAASQDICLFWDVDRTNSPDNNIVKISLSPMQLTSYNGGVCADTKSLSSSNKVDGMMSDKVNEEESDTPSSVLQFERALRKAQHAKKAGKEVYSEDLKIVYKDDHIIVVNKPPGVLSVPGLHSRASILTIIHELFGTTSMDQMIVHRLDMDTSGLIVFGLTVPITKLLHVQFRDRVVQKEYEALVVGHFPSGEYLLDLPLQRDHKHPPFMRVSTPASELEAGVVIHDLQAYSEKRKQWKHPQPKPSQTRIRVVEHGMFQGTLPYTRLRLEPITGRTHQLRVHCAALGFPIVGDPTYGLFGEAAPGGGLSLLPVMNGPKRPDPTLQQEWLKEYRPNDKPMCLHAAVLQIRHPLSGETLCWNEPPDF